MPYYYHGGVDMVYLLFLLPALVLTLWAEIRVSGSFRRYSAVRNARGMTGAEAAMAVLRYHGVHDVGVAAHEAGHAVQYAQGYGPIRLRSAILPVCSFGSRASFIVLMLGLVLYSQNLLLLGIVLFSLAALFQLITLPVEYNASRRAIETIEGGGFLTEEETRGAKKVLSAAALTYVAALLTSIAQLLRYVLIFLARGGGRRNRR